MRTEYPLVFVPNKFCKPQYEYTVTEAKEYFEWFKQIKGKRLEVLTGFINRFSQDFFLNDFSPDSLRKLFHFFSHLFLKQDTLINDCGGDYYVRVKVPYETKEYTGTGSDKKELVLSTQAYNLKLTYDFFKEPDKLAVYDQNGKELYHTDMTATNGKQVIVIPIVGVTKLTFKITSEVQSSQWSFKAETE